MNAIVTNRMVNNYFRFMKNWETEVKNDLISKLTESIDKNSNEQFDFSSCFGAWDDSRSAEEIFSEIRADRTNQKEIEGF